MKSDARFRVKIHRFEGADLCDFDAAGFKRGKSCQLFVSVSMLVVFFFVVVPHFLHFY
jgi:hypothetical protein